jgi:hypothetical protein
MPLPLFYSLELEHLPEGDQAFTEERTGAMRIESPLGWTQMLRPTAKHIAKVAGIEEMTVRRIAALRHVAGELRLAGKLNGRDRPTLLERLGCPLPPRPLNLPQVRPEWIRMPLLDRHAGWSEREKKWVD